ncbi:unnamed protein product [Acanthoscelides obtectus]|uniref:Uncharacterized protein n=1 Tax=Acanthoscelides obtectus TaxID=200917 RepID=A0A9P0VP08_ACAOB|nr:unnamed protein product [Acanthoscelides obtectus]CAK1682864.1 hypothetical protein AOBTE_LOCUS33946 [Acanthoscelides obtectus]
MNAAARRQDQSVSKDADREYEMEKENELDEFDSDFIDTEDENCTDGQELERQKKSKRKRKPENIHWAREKTKRNGMEGKDYLGYSRSKTGQILHNSETQCRSLGSACSSMKCLKYKKRHCNIITHEERLSIFKKFWTDMSWEQKQIDICSKFDGKERNQKEICEVS